MRYTELVEQYLPEIRELFPWDVAEWLDDGGCPLIVDVREPYEFEVLRIPYSINVPRGILETASEYGYEETVPTLAAARQRDIVLVCRSGNRSALGAWALQQLGFESVYSLKTGLKGWNDYELELVDASGAIVLVEEAEEYFTPRLSPEQLGP